MNFTLCAICDGELGAPIYTSSGSRSLTSLCRIHPATTIVYSCQRCGHLQTEALPDVDAYYDEHYDILVDSEEEDQIYEVLSGKPIYRTQHQVKVLRAKLDIDRDIDLLDYGCAKSSTIRALCVNSKRITPYLFDVSNRYTSFWEKFVHPDNWAINKTKADWTGRFDIVTSFFSLEHIPTVTETTRDIARLLKPGGTFYAIVPNVFGNVADFIVIDHCNHFTQTSIRKLLGDAGLNLLEIDEQAHRGAFVITANRLPDKISSSVTVTDVARACKNLSQLADFWRDASTRIRAFEASLGEDTRLAIYGAGFYGAFIAANLAHPERIICHLDQNPYLQSKQFNSRPVLPPNALPPSIDTILVGINPTHARTVIAGIPGLANRNLNYFYL